MAVETPANPATLELGSGLRWRQACATKVRRLQSPGLAEAVIHQAAQERLGHLRES